jgi:hypothetical protein
MIWQNMSILFDFPNRSCSLKVTTFNTSNTHIKNYCSILYTMSKETEREENQKETHESENKEQEESE